MIREENINILSLSMADTTEYGMLRMVVSDPERAKDALRAKGFSAMLTDVLAVKLEDKVGALHKMTHILCSQGLNIEYMYALASANRRAMIVKASDGEAAGKAVMEGGMFPSPPTSGQYRISQKRLSLILACKSPLKNRHYMPYSTLL